MIKWTLVADELERGVFWNRGDQKFDNGGLDEDETVL
jgi:hypothetical protein